MTKPQVVVEMLLRAETPVQYMIARWSKSGKLNKTVREVMPLDLYSEVSASTLFLLEGAYKDSVVELSEVLSRYFFCCKNSEKVLQISVRFTCLLDKICTQDLQKQNRNSNSSAA
jgi:hypothetical protein